MPRTHSITRRRVLGPAPQGLALPRAEDVVRLAGFTDERADVVVLAVHDFRHLPGTTASVGGRDGVRVLLEVLPLASWRGYQRADEPIRARKVRPLDLRDVEGYADHPDLAEPGVTPPDPSATGPA